MTNTRGLYDYKFALLNRGEVLNKPSLDSSPHSFFRVKPNDIQVESLCLFILNTCFKIGIFEPTMILCKCMRGTQQITSK